MSDSLGVARGRVLIDTSDVQRAQREVQSASQLMRNSLGQLAGAFGIAFGAAQVAQMARALDELTKQAAQAERTRIAFDSLAAGAGQSADDMLSAMREASRGMVADANLVLSANRAMLLGVADSGEELAQLLEVARVRGKAMGIDTTQAFNDIVTGIGRMSPLILDNLGIVTGGERIYSDYAKSVGRTADSLSDAEKKQILLNKVVEDSQPLVKAAGNEADNAADAFERYAVAVENSRQALGDLLKDGTANTRTFWTVMLDGLTDYLRALRQIQQGGLFNNAPQQTGPFVDDSQMGLGRSRASGGFTSDQKSAISEWAQSVKEIERQANRDRLDATRQYEQQRTDTIRQYEQTIAREAQDFAIGRARAEEDYARGLERFRRDVAQREARQLEDLERTIAEARTNAAEQATDRQVALDERLAEVRATSRERVAEMEEDFQRRRERAARDHQEGLLDAAGRLDALAIANQQREFIKRRRDEQEDFDVRLSRERKNEEKRLADLEKANAKQVADQQKALDKQIRQANEAYQRQLDDARDADEQRLADMSADFALRQAREDEDRAIRLERLKEDHDAQLAEQARQHEDRLIQIAEQEADEIRLANEAFDARMADLNIYHGGVKDAETAHYTSALIRYKEYLDEKDKELARRTAQQGPMPLNPMITPGGVPSLATPSSVTTSSRTANVIVNQQIFAAPGQSAFDVGMEVRRSFELLLQELGR